MGVQACHTALDHCTRLQKREGQNRVGKEGRKECGRREGERGGSGERPRVQNEIDWRKKNKLKRHSSQFSFKPLARN
jgi:hypothetical protein